LEGRIRLASSKSGGASVVLPKAEGLVVSLPVAPPNVQVLEVGVELEVAGVLASDETSEPDDEASA
jgi:hypothetical protein